MFSQLLVVDSKSYEICLCVLHSALFFHSSSGKRVDLDWGLCLVWWPNCGHCRVNRQKYRIFIRTLDTWTARILSSLAKFHMLMGLEIYHSRNLRKTIFNVLVLGGGERIPQCLRVCSHTLLYLLWKSIKVRYF